MVLGAVGTGKTSGCMYPYVEQLLRWKAEEEDQKVGGLVLEVKRDFRVQVKSILARANRPSDYIGIGLNTAFATTLCTRSSIPTPWRTQAATLLNDLFGRSKEPFWQQPGRLGVYDVRKPKGGGWAARRHQLDAVERWCDHD